MEFQNLQAADYTAIRAKYEDPEAVVLCPRCGSRLRYVVKNRFEELGIIYNIECSSGCFFYPIPPSVTPESIKWNEPREEDLKVPDQ